MADEQVIEPIEPAEPNDFPSSWDEIFQHPRFKELNSAKKEAKSKLAILEANRQKVEEESLKEKEEWKTLYEQSKDELEREKIERLRLLVAAEAGRPELSNRIQGSTEEEMKEDVNALIELLKPATGPGVPKPVKSSQPNVLDINNMTPEEIRNNVKNIINQATVS